MSDLNTKSKDKQEISSSAAGIARRKFLDHVARYVVTTGGIAIILSILAILVFIGIEVIPLWQGVKSELTSTFITKESPELASYSLDSQDKNEFPFVATGSEEYREIGFIVSKDGVIHFISLKDGSTIKEVSLAGIENTKVTSDFVSVNNKLYAFGTEDGYIVPVRFNYRVTFDKDSKRVIDPEITEENAIAISTSPLLHIAYEESPEEGSAAAAYTGSGELLFVSFTEEESFMGEGGITKNETNLTQKLDGNKVAAIEMDYYLENLYVATESGKLFHFDITNNAEPALLEAIDVTDNPRTPVTALGFLIGDRSLIIGDASGHVSVWFQVKDATSGSGFRLKKIHELDPLELPVTKIVGSARDRGFIASDSRGNVNLYHATSNQLLYKLNADNRSVMNLSFAPKADGIIAVNNKGKIHNWYIDNPHPETNLKTLFSKVWYEGYSEPRYVWQSTGGTDDYEPKFSLTPLAYGTLKGAIYALFIAIPLSILGAICVSQFMHPTLRNVIKPVIEVMAALPSVVLGFFAGLWLAPHIEKFIPAVFILPIVITLLTLLSVFVWRLLPRTLRGRFKGGTELFLLIPVIIIAALISFWLNTPLESALLGGDYQGWLYNVLGMQYDQRNALIVGFAMGFAVIPIIFTISDDALSSVPKHLTAGSLALGATRWQTAMRVILPTASPGISSAVMIGLGRAVGETMIVLMATGNTPIMDWSIFNGFRAISANIAVEIPEAPHGGTLYRIIFLAALLLFFFTFAINTVAEIVRHRLRKKYGQL